MLKPSQQKVLLTDKRICNRCARVQKCVNYGQLWTADSGSAGQDLSSDMQNSTLTRKSALNLTRGTDAFIGDLAINL